MYQSDDFHKRSRSVNNRKYRNVNNIANTSFEVEKLYQPVEKQKFTYDTRRDTNSSRLYYNATQHELGNDHNRIFGRPKNTNNLYKSIGKKVDNKRSLYPGLERNKDRSHLYPDGFDRSPGKYSGGKFQRTKSVDPQMSNKKTIENKPVENNNQNDANLEDINVQGNAKLQDLKPTQNTQDKMFAENNLQQNDEPIQYGEF